MSRVVLAKAWIGALGLATGIAGMALRTRWMTWVGVALLAVVLALRLLERKSVSES